MRYLYLFRIRQKILFRKTFLNILLLLLPLNNKFIVTLSQNLDKYIVIYQQELFLCSESKD